MPFTENNPFAGVSDQLLKVAHESIGNGLIYGEALKIDATQYPPLLQAHRASFVTMHRAGKLRGCIGSLEATRELIADVSENAFSAAFRDPRFTPLYSAELVDLEIHIAILSPLEPLSCDSDEALLRLIVPHRDGLVLDDGRRRGTFLPSVWESLPQPEEFLYQLKQKAGLPDDCWTPTLKVYRYFVDEVPARVKS